MSLPNSKAHKPIDAQKPNTIATIAQRKGHGNALRTAIRGALMVKRRRSRRNLMEREV
jgi:hypothetical protein